MIRCVWIKNHIQLYFGTFARVKWQSWLTPGPVVVYLATIKSSKVGPSDLVEIRKEIRKRGEKNVGACAAALALHNNRMARWECECVWVRVCADRLSRHWTITYCPGSDQYIQSYVFIYTRSVAGEAGPLITRPAELPALEQNQFFSCGKGRQGLQICWHRDNCETAWEPFGVHA